MLIELAPQATAILKRAISNNESGTPSEDSRPDIESVIEHAATQIHRASGYRTTLAEALSRFIRTPEGKALYAMLMRYDTPNGPSRYDPERDASAPVKKIVSDGYQVFVTE